MSVEAATYIADLQSTNPPSGDPTSQGDDHLRLIKSVLQNTLIGASRAFQIPSTLAKTASYSVAKADGESVIYSNTAAGAITYTLPTLTSADNGWKVHFIKTSSDANPMFIKAASGNVNSGGTSVAQARRCIPAIKITVVWDGANWFITRAIGLPIGSLVSFFSATLPAGYEWPNGQTLTSASTNYPEYYAANGNAGTTLDFRGRADVTLDNLGGSAAGRIGTIINGTTVGNTGGTETYTQLRSDMPNIAFTFSGNSSGQSFLSSLNNTGLYDGANSFYSGTVSGNSTAVATPSGSVVVGGSGNSLNGNVAQTAMSNCQPSLVCAKILVVE